MKTSLFKNVTSRPCGIVPPWMACPFAECTCSKKSPAKRCVHQWRSNSVIRQAAEWLNVSWLESFSRKSKRRFPAH